MRPFSRGFALALTLYASCIQAWKIPGERRDTYSSPIPPKVPSYNISMPVDHFNASDTRMFNNQYFVNDTYYKPGGPVIFFDFGEEGVNDVLCASYLAEWNKWQDVTSAPLASAPLELAKSLNGIVIGWEHRYYGYSRPFPVEEWVNNTYNGDTSYITGIPLGGAPEYRYLTVEQSLEDVVYFANHFNQTRLGPGNTVVSGENATQMLDPWHTPWIWVGGSYPGARGAWLRLRNPEVIYAVWASSAVVQIVPDASAYTNSIYRALPKNCTADVRAAVGHIDDIVDSGNQDQIRHLDAQINNALSRHQPPQTSTISLSPDPAPIQDLLYSVLTSDAQYLGYSSHPQRFCDFMERFDVPSFLSNSSLQSSDGAEDVVFYWNDDNAAPSAEGIAASNGKRGAEVALSAYLFGMNYEYFGSHLDFKRSLSNAPSVRSDTAWQDTHSWEWQVLSELGLVISVNASSPLALGSKHLDYSFERENIKILFPDFAAADIPDAPDTRFPNAFGGWNMRPSNVMFTNGEFDPWRAYTVMSLEQDIGAPLRRVTQDIPKCGEPPASSDVFGLLYGGAVHTEDMAFTSMVGEHRGSEDTAHPPLRQGLELFVKAYEAWLPCFNSSRGQLATWNATSATNSTNPDKSGARPTSVADWGWAIIGIFSVVLYHAL